MPTLDEIIAANDRRRRAEQALAYARATGQDNDHAVRTLPNGRDYLLGPDGAITAPVAHDRPLDPGEYAALDRARASGDDMALAALYAPERRARAVPYWESAYLDPAAEAARREEALWRAAERRTVRSDRRAEAVRALLAHERAYGNAPSDRQRLAAQRWADQRALAGDPPTRAALDRRDCIEAAARDRAERMETRRLAAESAQAQSRDTLAAALAKAQAERAAAQATARGTVSVAQEETRRALDLANANNAHAIALETLRGQNALGLAGANNASAERVAQAQAEADRYAADQERLGQTESAQTEAASAERVAQIRAQANRDVALLQGSLAAARAQGALSPEQDAAFKRAETLVRLSQSLARGGLDETALLTLDSEIDNDKSLSPEEKAARKAQLRQNNPEAVSWLLGAAARQMEAAGLPGMPTPGQTAQAASHGTPADDIKVQDWL